MSNIINSQNLNINNPVPAYNLSLGRKENSVYIQAPNSLPVVTADSLLKEKDDFRRQITEAQNLSMLPKVRKKHTKLKLFLAAAVAFALFAIKKKK